MNSQRFFNRQLKSGKVQVYFQELSAAAKVEKISRALLISWKTGEPEKMTIINENWEIKEVENRR